MRYIQTLFISKDQNLFEDSFGWVSPLYHLISWGLSAMTLKKALGNLTLYTNSYGKEILIDLLHLPYDNVVLSFEGWELPHKELWALSKIYTYSLQTEPFIHIDGDIYLFKPMPAEFETAHLIAQNIEEFTDYYYSVMKPINRKFTYLPKYVMGDFSKQESLHAVNAGILGGNDISFFKKYTTEATKYVESNIAFLKTLDANRFNVFFEQHLFYNMAQDYNIDISYLLSQKYHDNAYLGLDLFHEIPSGKSWYFHLLGNYKRDLHTCQQMAKALNALYPKVYSRIVAEYNKYKNGKYSHEITHTQSQNIIVSTIRDTIKPGVPKPWLPDLLDYIDKIQDFLTSNKDVVLPSLLEWERNSFYWYNEIFESTIPYGNVKIEMTPLASVVISKYDWARLYKSRVSSGIKYYVEFSVDQLAEGSFSSVFVLDSTETISISDIDDIEYAILQDLSSPQTISELEKSMMRYLEMDGYDESLIVKFKTLITNAIQRLVLLKVIRPTK